jgi:hypothetical protein
MTQPQMPAFDQQFVMFTHHQGLSKCLPHNTLTIKMEALPIPHCYTTPQTLITTHKSLFGHGMSSHILHCIPHAGNPIGLCIRNFNGKFILNGHHNLHGIKGIQSQVISEFGGGGYFRGVNFVKVFDNGDDSFLDFGRVKECL